MDSFVAGVLLGAVVVAVCWWVDRRATEGMTIMIGEHNGWLRLRGRDYRIMTPDAYHDLYRLAHFTSSRGDEASTKMVDS